MCMHIKYIYKNKFYLNCRLQESNACSSGIGVSLLGPRWECAVLCFVCQVWLALSSARQTRWIHKAYTGHEIVKVVA